MNDEKIVELYLKRDESALKLTSEKYGAALRKIALGILNSKADAEECENDTYLKAWNSIPPNEPRGYLFAFLARITRFTAISRVRQNSAKNNSLFTELTEEMELCIPSPSDTESALDSKQLSEAVSTFLRTLPEQKRCIFIRRYWYADTVKGISERYNISESKVKSSLFRTRTGLRDYLIKEGYTL